MYIYYCHFTKLCRYKVYVHAVNKNGGAEVVAPVDVSSSITLACKLL